MKRRWNLLLLAAAVCMTCLGGGMTLAEERAEDAVKQTVTPEEFGGYPSDGEDDTEAFRQALATGHILQLSKGAYELSAPLALTEQSVLGAGSSATILSSSCGDKAQPILRLGGRCTVSDLTLQYGDKLVDWTEKEGERVAVWLGGEKPADGSQLKNLRITQVGTGIYAPDNENAGASRLLADTLYIPDFSYRGVDLQKAGQVGNTFSNVYIGGKASLEIPRSAGFAAEGGEYNLVVDQLNLEHSIFDSALLLRNCYGARLGSVHMEAVGQAGPGTGSVRVENADVFIDGITMYYNPLDYPDCSIVELGDAGSGEGNRLVVGTLHLKGLNSVHPNNHAAREGGLNNPNARGFKVISRSAGATGTYEVDIAAYVWYTWHGEQEIYAAFPCDESGIRYLSKGFDKGAA